MLLQGPLACGSHASSPRPPPSFQERKAMVEGLTANESVLARWKVHLTRIPRSLTSQHQKYPPPESCPYPVMWNAMKLKPHEFCTFQQPVPLSVPNQRHSTCSSEKTLCSSPYHFQRGVNRKSTRLSRGQKPHIQKLMSSQSVVTPAPSPDALCPGTDREYKLKTANFHKTPTKNGIVNWRDDRSAVPTAGTPWSSSIPLVVVSVHPQEKMCEVRNMTPQTDASAHPQGNQAYAQNTATFAEVISQMNQYSCAPQSLQKPGAQDECPDYKVEERGLRV